MKYLLIENIGEIDTKAFELIGASTKRDDDTKIGRFGSGLNYSLAWLMRNNLDFHIFSGNSEIKFSKQPEVFRNKIFEVILINGKTTSFTTDMGVDWKSWFVIREILCNAIDEVEYTTRVVENINSEKGKTQFYIQIDNQIQEVIDNWQDYFSDKRTDLVCEVDGVKVYKGGVDLIVYRKGIRCHFAKGKNCAYHYDFPDVKINESRIAEDVWQLEYDITKFWTMRAPVDLIRQLLRKIVGTFEYGLKWELCDYSMNEMWKLAVGDKMIVEKEMKEHYAELSAHNDPLVLPSSLASALMKKFDSVEHIGGNNAQKGIQVLEMNPAQKILLNTAMDIFKQCEYEIKFPVYVSRFLKKGIIGLAYDKKIFVSEEAFENLNFLLQVIIEENEHNVTGFDDNTRAFQTHFIQLFLNEKIKRFNINL